VYAGAAREAVFSVPAVMRRVQADFVPLALRAPAVNRPDSVPDDDERWLYRRIHRARLAPQGICILNSAGQVLAWVQMFDDDQSVLAFLGHGLDRFRENDDARQLVVTERYMMYPSLRQGDLQDEAELPAVIAERHPQGKRCTAANGKGKVPPGSFEARLVGRALDDQGRPVADTVRQEQYVEDKFIITPEMQEALAGVLATAGAAPVRLPEEFARLCAVHAHLGHIDVQPCLCMIKGQAENKGEWKRCDFRAQKVKSQEAASLWRIEGESEVVSEVAINGQGVHDVRLDWEGFIEMQGTRIRQLVLSAQGREKLQFAKDDHPLKREKRAEVAILPGGRPIDIECGVRYGILGDPVAEEAAEPARAAADAIPDIPEEGRRHLIEALGGPYLVYRDKVLDEIKVSKGHRRKLFERLPGVIQETMRHFQKLESLKPTEREKEHQSYRQKAQELLTDFLKETLGADQLKRLRQIELQQDGPFAILSQPGVGESLKVTGEQRPKFMAVVQEMQKQIEPLIKEARAGGNPTEIGPRVMKIRNQHAEKIQAILSDYQKKEWKEMLGKPFDLRD
jgi:hypothetical protein